MHKKKKKQTTIQTRPNKKPKRLSYLCPFDCYSVGKPFVITIASQGSDKSSDNGGLAYQKNDGWQGAKGVFVAGTLYVPPSDFFIKFIGR
jgi:hypothetical protein